jgi:hypothetical protein
MHGIANVPGRSAMKLTPSSATSPSGTVPQPKRRGLLLGAGTAAAAAAVTVVASRSAVEPAAVPAAQARADDDSGYRLTDHVRRYYETART